MAKIKVIVIRVIYAHNILIIETPITILKNVLAEKLMLAHHKFIKLKPWCHESCIINYHYHYN